MAVVSQANVVDLESSIKQLAGVLGCVILTDDRGGASEIQAFTRQGTDRGHIQAQILEEVGKKGLRERLRRVFVFELDADSGFGDREMLERVAEVAEQEARARGPLERAAPDSGLLDGEALYHAPLPNRPPLKRVALTSSEWTSQAEVALAVKDSEVVGEASGDKTPHGLKVLAHATLEAIAKLMDQDPFRLEGASLVNAFGREAVLVLVEVGGAYETLGGALVRQRPVSEAAVRATLDAVNRRLTQER